MQKLVPITSENKKIILIFSILNLIFSVIWMTAVIISLFMNLPLVIMIIAIISIVTEFLIRITLYCKYSVVI